MAESAKSWWARALLVGSVIAAVLLLLGALGTRLGVWSFQIGFLAVMASTVLAAIGLLVGIVAIFVSRKRGYVEDKPSIMISLAISVLILVMMGLQFKTAISVPQIHNISTDITDPPQFYAVIELRGEGSNPLEYDVEVIPTLQQAAYPWVQTLEVDSSNQITVAEVKAALEDMGLEIVAINTEAEPGTGIVEATDTSFWFGFKDDIVVRIRPAEGGGSIVDARSVSRVGLSDLGANARRIGQLLERLQG